jgi:hypothetical protein
MKEISTRTKKPTHRAYFIRGEGEAARWLELGNVWSHVDGHGFELVLDTLPVGGFNGRIVIRANEADHAGASEGELPARLTMAGRAFTGR